MYRPLANTEKMYYTINTNIFFKKYWIPISLHVSKMYWYSIPIQYQYFINLFWWKKIFEDFFLEKLQKFFRKEKILSTFFKKAPKIFSPK